MKGKPYSKIAEQRVGDTLYVCYKFTRELGEALAVYKVEGYKENLVWISELDPPSIFDTRD